MTGGELKIAWKCDRNASDTCSGDVASGPSGLVKAKGDGGVLRKRRIYLKK